MENECRGQKSVPVPSLHFLRKPPNRVAKIIVSVAAVQKCVFFQVIARAQCVKEWKKMLGSVGRDSSSADGTNLLQ